MSVHGAWSNGTMSFFATSDQRLQQGLRLNVINENASKSVCAFNHRQPWGVGVLDSTGQYSSYVCKILLPANC